MVLVHYPLPNGHCAWSILPVGEANGILLGTASWQQAGYTRVGYLGRLAQRTPNGHRRVSLVRGSGPKPGGPEPGLPAGSGQEDVPFW